MKVNYDFSGRVVLVAGAGSGIGLAMTRACLEAGATVLASDIRVQALTELDHPRCEVAQLDITDSAAVNAMCKRNTAAWAALTRPCWPAAFNSASPWRP
jgi:NAD(P)-dependent dehydrogenase (short-subunit alcohol dehydrogenase family)